VNATVINCSNTGIVNACYAFESEYIVITVMLTLLVFDTAMLSVSEKFYGKHLSYTSHVS